MRLFSFGTELHIFCKRDVSVKYFVSARFRCKEEFIPNKRGIGIIIAIKIFRKSKFPTEVIYVIFCLTVITFFWSWCKILTHPQDTFFGIIKFSAGKVVNFCERFI